MEGHSGYLKEALNKEAGVIFKRAVGVTQPRALSLRRSEEEAQREHDLQKVDNHYSTFIHGYECLECTCGNVHLIDFLRIAANHHGTATSLKMRADSPMIEKNGKHHNENKQLKPDH